VDTEAIGWGFTTAVLAGLIMHHFGVNQDMIAGWGFVIFILATIIAHIFV